MAKLITKIDREPTHSDINTLKNEQAERATKIKTTKDIVKHGKKYGFLIIVVGLAKYQPLSRTP